MQQFTWAACPTVDLGELSVIITSMLLNTLSHHHRQSVAVFFG
jgi:hypothetical protein